MAHKHSQRPIRKAMPLRKRQAVRRALDRRDLEAVIPFADHVQHRPDGRLVMIFRHLHEVIARWRGAVGNMA